MSYHFFYFSQCTLSFWTPGYVFHESGGCIGHFHCPSQYSLDAVHIWLDILNTKWCIPWDSTTSTQDRIGMITLTSSGTTFLTEGKINSKLTGIDWSKDATYCFPNYSYCENGRSIIFPTIIDGQLHLEKDMITTRSCTIHPKRFQNNLLEMNRC